MPDNIWRRGSLLKNPYARTAFRVARVPRSEARRRRIVTLIGETRNIVRSDAAAHKVAGEPVTETDLNAAEQALLDPVQRAGEELLFHYDEKLPLERIRVLAQQVEAAMAVPAEMAADPEARRGALMGLMAWVAQAYADQLETPVSPLGAMELELAPPFGGRDGR